MTPEILNAVNQGKIEEVKKQILDFDIFLEIIFKHRKNDDTEFLSEIFMISVENSFSRGSSTTLLQYYIEQGSIEMVKFFFENILKNEANLEILRTHRMINFAWDAALRRNQLEIIEIFLQHGIQCGDTTVAWEGVQSNNLPLMKLLFKYQAIAPNEGILVNTDFSFEVSSLLNLAIKRDNFEIVKLLIHNSNRGDVDTACS